MKITKRVVAVVLVVVLLLALLSSAFIIFFGNSASAATSAEIQTEIDALKDKADSLSQQKTDIENTLAGLETQQGDVVNQKILMDQQIELTRQEIENSNDVIQQYTVLIAQQQTELDDTLTLEQKQLDTYATRIRAMEENGSTSYVAILMGAGSFSDLLTRIDMISEIVESDNSIIDNLTKTRDNITQLQAEVEVSKTEQQTAKDQLTQQETSLETQVQQATYLLKQLEDSEAQYEAMYAEVEAIEAQTASSIDSKIAQYNAAVTAEEQERQRLAALASAGVDYVDESDFSWPSYCNIITCVYGMRTHPITGNYSLHTGVDIGASYGSSIYASKSGSVITAGYNYAYGNYVVIYHGNGVSTLYAHMSQRAVSEGDYVLKGSVIGYVGSTGYSTGAHLHFEIRINGSFMDPLTYFSGKTFVYY